MCVSAMQALELELELCGSGGIAACPRHSISILLSLNMALLLAVLVTVYAASQ
jgi:hypothetical protein